LIYDDSRRGTIYRAPTIQIEQFFRVPPHLRRPGGMSAAMLQGRIMKLQCKLQVSVR
jgi:hypothetical protein